MWRPQFDSLWYGPWPHESFEGVGLMMVGLPKDEERFLKYLSANSCHPSAGRRILSRIKQNGFDKLTVMATALNFDEIAVQLESMGVTMTIIHPQEGWVSRYEDGPYPDGYGADAKF